MNSTTTTTTTVLLPFSLDELLELGEELFNRVQVR
jgi:hypothetical protein